MAPTHQSPLDSLRRVKADLVSRWRSIGASTSNTLVGTWATRNASFDQVPRDMHTVDPTRASEWIDGYIALGNASIQLRNQQVFDVPPPTDYFAEELHSFEWLRNLRAYELPSGQSSDVTAIAARHARRQVLNWLERRGQHPAIAHLPYVAARRALAMTKHAAFLLNDAPPQDYRAIMTMILETTRYAFTHRARLSNPSEYLFLTVACASVAQALPEHLQMKSDTLEALVEAVERCLLEDGCPVTRSVCDLPTILASLLSLTALMSLRQSEIPAPIQKALANGLIFLRFMRHPDGSLARFHGTLGISRVESDLVASVLFHDVERPPLPAQLEPSGFTRLSAGPSTVLINAGGLPPSDASRQAHASAFAFEWTHDNAKIITSAPELGYTVDADLLDQRQTQSHSTVCVNDAASATFIDDTETSAMTNAGLSVVRENEPISPNRVFRAHHTGYRAQFGVDHARSLTLSEDGNRLEGRDQLLHPTGQVATNNLQPFAVIFQLQPGIRVTREDAQRVRLQTRGQSITFEADQGTISIENPTDRPTYRGTHPAYRLVINNPIQGPLSVQWRFLVQAPVT